jgi:crotonobetainyl-CoA:carnitine CoA-transferase CaiB-like acyl-CoA transferase
VTGGDALLGGARVVDLSTGIPGAYCTKLLADAGADVVKVEPPGGDPLRRWSASGAELGDADGPLFRFLHASKRSVVGDPPDPALLAAADLVVDSGRLDDGDLARVRAAGTAVVSITPFGRTGPAADRPATEFTLQGWCGSIAGRGHRDAEPLHVGGRLGEWIAGSYASVAAVALLRATGGAGGAGDRAGRTAPGEHADVSVMECMAITMTISYGALQRSLGVPAPPGPPRTVELPSIEPTADGYVGFTTVTRQQFDDLLLLVERPDLLGDEDLATQAGRQRRRDEFLAVIRDWTTQRTTAEVVELASLLRIPVTPIGAPDTLAGIDQFVERGVFVPNPGGGFDQPRVPYRVDGRPAPPFRPAPRLGEHAGSVTWADAPVDAPARTAGADGGGPDLPLAGIRVADLSAFWAGPAATHVLAALGAEVIKVESVQRPDGMRFTSARGPGDPDWWEWSWVFHAMNRGKRAVTLDLTSERGRSLLHDLLRQSDVLVENFSPRVLESFGLDRDVLDGINPRLVTIRMPAFGLDGPWRDRTGFAQTMEQASGMAWMTGFADGPPVNPRGACDPMAGMHAAFAVIAALAERDRSDRGHLIESTMVEAALNVAAELTIERSAHGASLSRRGNRGPVAVPQGLYPCAGDERWLALAVAGDDQWRALRGVLGEPPWAADPQLDTEAGRRLHEDEIDAHVRAWAATEDRDAAVAALVAAGVPAAPVREAQEVPADEQLRHRGFVESYDHLVAGRHEVLGVPFRFASRPGPWHVTAAPTLGQHNDEVLGGLLGLTAGELAELRAAGVVGERPAGL